MGGVRSSRAAASPIRRGSRPGGRTPRSRHSDRRLRRRRKVVADGEAQVAQRAFIGVEAQDLGAGRGAVHSEARAEGSGAGRVAAQESVEQGEACAGEEERIALPCPSAGPRPGRDRRRRRKGLPFRGFGNARLRSRALASVAVTLSPRSSARVARRSGSARITWAWQHGGGALSALLLGYPPRLSGCGDVR